MLKNIYDYPQMPTISPVTRMPEQPLSWEYFIEYARLKYEQGADKEKIQQLIDHVVKTVEDTSQRLIALPDDQMLSLCEPDSLEEIRKLRPRPMQKTAKEFDKESYRKKIKGAVNGRFAGCTLGAPVEFWSVEAMKEWAEYCGQSFPPEEYWRKTKNPSDIRYEVSIFEEYEKDRLTKVPVDDDVTYTILGLLVLEQFGLDFTTEDVGKVWLEYLPRACTAEEVVLNHLKSGMDAMKAAEIHNPYVQWIGADIRSDAWGFAAPGLPEKAAELAYQDAYLTHRRNGIYGEMYFSAVIAAAFTVDTMEEALKAGLYEIPSHCLLARDILWALEQAEQITDYKEARAAAEKYFDWMSGVHTNLNACLTIWGLLMGKDNFTKVIGEVTAMGYDNDCNAATAGSIFGAFYGIDRIPEQWYECFNNEVDTYLNKHPSLKIDEVCRRFEHFAALSWENETSAD